MKNVNFPVKRHGHAIRVILFCFFVVLVNSVVFSIIYQETPDKLANPIDKLTLPKLIFAAVLLGPLLETFIFQYLLINICLRISERWNAISKAFAAVVSASAFAISHSYSIEYQLSVICPGLAMAFIYLYFNKNYNRKTAFYTVASFHAFLNFCFILLT